MNAKTLAHGLDNYDISEIPANRPVGWTPEDEALAQIDGDLMELLAFRECGYSNSVLNHGTLIWEENLNRHDSDIWQYLSWRRDQDWMTSLCEAGWTHKASGWVSPTGKKRTGGCWMPRGPEYGEPYDGEWHSVTEGYGSRVWTGDRFEDIRPRAL